MDDPRVPGTTLDLALSIREHDLAWIELRPRRGLAVPIQISALRRLDQLLHEVEVAAADGAIRMLIITTPPPYPTLTGYDLEELLPLDEDEVVAWSQEAQAILRRIEQLPVPSIAAIQGEWLGGAAEIGLACSYRISSDTPTTHLGFPQTQVGSIPSWGGTVRLPRLVGLQTALQLVLTGEPVTPSMAAEAGLIDRIIPTADFEAGVTRYALRRLERGRPRARQRRPMSRRLLDDTAPGRRLLAGRAAASYLNGRNAPEAGRAALDLMSQTIALPLESAFQRESETAGQLLLSADAQGRLHSQRYTERTRLRLPIGTGDFEEGAVLGASQTASDIAYLLASAGTHTRVKAAKRELARLGVARARDRIQWDQQQGNISAAQARRSAARLEGVTGYGGFGTLDLAIAVAESSEGGVEEVLNEVEAHVGDSCLIAFHDWTASPTRVQRSLRFPERVVGITPALPSERFPLLEIVPGTLTSPESVSSARRLARRLSLTAVVVSDQTPTPGTRLLGAFLAESARLVEEGATLEQVDAVSEAFGFSVGPLKRIDALGAPRVFHLLQALAARLGDRMGPTSLLERLATEAATFYKYRDGRPVGPSTAVPTAAATGGDAVESLIRERILLLLVNEAALILEEGSVTDPGDLEIISLLALGFPRAHGGILFFAQSLGIGEVVQSLGREVVRSGDRFSPAGLLRDLAATGRGFFGNEGVTPAGHRAKPVLQ